MSKAFKIAGIGEVLFDVFPEKEAFGGAPANFACHSSFLGAEAYVVSCIGADSRGQQAEKFLNDHGVNTDGLCVTSEHETGVVAVALDSAGKPEYDIRENAAWDFIEWTAEMESIAAGLDAVCFGSLAQRSEVSRNTIHRFLKATGVDCLRIFDINLRQSYYNEEIVVSSLGMANAIKLSDEELPVVARMVGLSGSNEVMLAALADKYDLKLCVLTCGAKGALMTGRGQVSFQLPVDVDVVNTVGAGDSFTAAVAVGWLKGHSLDDINRHANEVASYVCTQVGAVPELPEHLTRRGIRY